MDGRWYDAMHELSDPARACRRRHSARRAERPRPKTADAVSNVQAIHERTALLAEDARVADRLQGLLTDVEYGGK